MMGCEQIAHLLHLLVPGQMHRQDIAPSACLVQVDIASVEHRKPMSVCPRSIASAYSQPVMIWMSPAA